MIQIFVRKSIRFQQNKFVYCYVSKGNMSRLDGINESKWYYDKNESVGIDYMRRNNLRVFFTKTNGDII